MKFTALFRCSERLSDESDQSRSAAVVVLIVLNVCLASGCAVLPRYRVNDHMEVEVAEYSTSEYPDDPAAHSARYGQYQGRNLHLVDNGDGKHFDFIFQPQCGHVGRVVFRNVDVSLMTPELPCHVRGDKGLERITLVDREWNRQQVHFGVPGPHVEVTGGDGFERCRLTGASLAKNCLNAGLWEVMLSVDECGEKKCTTTVGSHSRWGNTNGSGKATRTCPAGATTACGTAWNTGSIRPAQKSILANCGRCVRLTESIFTSNRVNQFCTMASRSGRKRQPACHTPERGAISYVAAMRRSQRFANPASTTGTFRGRTNTGAFPVCGVPTCGV